MEGARNPSALAVFLLALASGTVSSLTNNTQHAPQLCKDLTDRELREKVDRELSLTLNFRLHDTFYQLPSLLQASMEENFEEFKKTGPVDIHRGAVDSELGDSLTCGTSSQPAQAERDANTNVTDPCPHRWVFNVDHNRVPEVLMEVQCSACACLHTPAELSGIQEGQEEEEELSSHRRRRHHHGHQGHHRSSHGRKSMALTPPSGPADRTRCSEVYYYTRVLRKTKECDVEGKYIYKPILEPIAVGCACRAAPSKASNKTEDEERAFSGGEFPMTDRENLVGDKDFKQF